MQHNYCGLKSVVLNNLLNINRLRCKDDRPSVLLLSTSCLELLVSRCDGSPVKKLVKDIFLPVALADLSGNYIFIRTI